MAPSSYTFAAQSHRRRRVDERIDERIDLECIDLERIDERVDECIDECIDLERLHLYIARTLRVRCCAPTLRVRCCAPRSIDRSIDRSFHYEGGKEKERTPGFCDRVLFASLSPEVT